MTICKIFMGDSYYADWCDFGYWLFCYGSGLYAPENDNNDIRLVPGVVHIRRADKGPHPIESGQIEAGNDEK